MSTKLSTVLLFAVATSVAPTAQHAFGQAPGGGVAGKPPYTSMPVMEAMKPLNPELVAADENVAADDAKRARERASAYNDARKVMSGQIPLDENGKKVLDKWYKGFFLPSFTLPESRGELPELRDALLRELRTARSPAAVAYVRSQVMTYMRAYTQSPPPNYNFHPAVRYNAMLVIGSLNAVEYGARYGSDQKAASVPDPLPEALDVLVSEYRSPTQIDAVRVAALVGLERHAKLDAARPVERRISGTKKKVIVDDMIALLNSPPPANRTAEGHTWMQRRAIDILAAFGMVGAYPEANAALEKIVGDKETPISLRCTASESLAQWAPASKATIDATNVAKNLGLIAVKACTDELERIAALEREEKEMKWLSELIKKPNPVIAGQLAGGGGTGSDMYAPSYEVEGAPEMETSPYGPDMGYGGMYGMPGMPGAPGAAIPTDPRIVWSQRRLKYQLSCVKLGLDGMAIAGKASQHEKAVARIAKAVEMALSMTDPPEDKPNLEGLSESIRKAISQLAFLSPEAAAIGAATPAAAATPHGAADPATPPAALPPSIDPAALPPAALPPAADPAALPVDPAFPALPPGPE